MTCSHPCPDDWCWQHPCRFCKQLTVICQRCYIQHMRDKHPEKYQAEKEKTRS